MQRRLELWAVESMRFAKYMARSALRSKVSTSAPSPGNMATPMLGVTTNVCSARRIGSCSSAMRRRATPAASSTERTFGKITMNSSPPRRAI